MIVRVPPVLIVDDGGETTLLIHEGMTVEDSFLKDGTIPELKRGLRTQGRVNNFSLFKIYFITMEKSDILKINKGGTIVSMNQYTQTQVCRLM